jgi:hypothetical protein
MFIKDPDPKLVDHKYLHRAGALMPCRVSVNDLISVSLPRALHMAIIVLIQGASRLQGPRFWIWRISQVAGEEMVERVKPAGIVVAGFAAGRGLL